MRHIPAWFVACLAAVTASATAPSCSADSKCPEEYPCCYSGQCGVGTYCLGGCNPLESFSLDSCAPEPICKNQTYSFTSLDNAVLYDHYLGNTTEYDWVYSGYPKIQNDSLWLTMPNGTTGSLYSLNHYIWYGKVSATIKSSRSQGVVTGFILLSDDLDEIDYEWVGYNLSSAQTDFYFQGVQNYTNERNAAVTPNNTFEDWHTYTIDWKPDVLEWIVDGTVMRTLTKNSTYNATSGVYMYPQTPSRLEMSIWPGGSEAEGTGTIEWAGGLIDWDSTDIQEYGYFYAQYKDITVECYDYPSGTIVKGDKSYVYTSDSGMSSTIEVSGNDTVLYNLQDTGLNMTAGSKTTSSELGSESGSSSGTSSGSSSSSGSTGTASGDSKSAGSRVVGSMSVVLGVVAALSLL
ncbi:glycoside hydrolase family 16 protein [Aspergillus carbonarius ITEM 5010]|uniref:Crh-like protein n=1 Tax=Aspergillus carbonarius (strain ITEM 5010) TaxID=602072 RepID=A0A1R3RKE0_ASPC5|nr:glycoside hydrolase family 16 protein [Aspergillus carbonarius ITEM 5010]